MKKVAFAGGGTGGHIYPNLAIIEDIRYGVADIEFFYFGNPKKLEASLISNPDIKDYKDKNFSDYVEFVNVNSEPLIKTFNPFKFFGWLKRFNKYVEDAKKKLLEKKIDLVFSTGGFAAGPTIAACKKLKIPYIIHNLDAHMGLANRAFYKDAIALTLGVCDLGLKPKSKNAFITGNPISKKFTETLKNYKKKEDDKLHLLVTGGSQGAKAINNAIGELLDEFQKLNIEIIHVTGYKNFAEHKKKYLKKNNDYDFYKVLDYTHNMPELCAWADIAICRSGAMTVAEMLASETLCIFIPLPWAAHDHQSKNAKAISDQGAAITLDQDQEDLKDMILKNCKLALEDKNYLGKFRDKIKKINASSSNSEIVKIILNNL